MARVKKKHGEIIKAIMDKFKEGKLEDRGAPVGNRQKAVDIAHAKIKKSPKKKRK